MDDDKLLDIALKALSKDGYIEFTGEYGNEVTTFIPFVAWLKQEGYLEGRRVISYNGMKSHYFFLNDGEFVEKRSQRHSVWDSDRVWPSNNDFTATKQDWHVIPDYREHYKDRGNIFQKPVIFVQNKFQVEWNTGPINYLPLGAIKEFVENVRNRFHIVYSRPGIVESNSNYSKDHNSFCDYPDRFIIEELDGVEIFEDTCARKNMDYNRTKLEYLSKCHVFVSVQGGGATIISAFGNSVLLILHRRGLEFPHAYSKGPYKYLAQRPPVLLIARDDDGLSLGMKVIGDVEVNRDKAAIPPTLLPTVAKLAM